MLISDQSHEGDEEQSLAAQSFKADELGSDEEQEDQPPPPQFTVLSCYAFLAAAVLSQNAFAWNTVFSIATFWPFVVALGIMFFAYANYINCMCELCALHPFAGGNYAFTRVTIGRFPAFLVGCLDVLHYAFSTFISLGLAATGFASLFDFPPVFRILFMLLLNVLIGATLAFTWKKSSLPKLFIGFAGFLAVLLLLFIFVTIPQMDFEKYTNNFDEEEDETSFGWQILYSMFSIEVFANGIKASFLLCDTVAVVR
jgi:amino acid transporter